MAFQIGLRGIRFIPADTEPIRKEGPDKVVVINDKRVGPQLINPCIRRELKTGFPGRFREGDTHAETPGLNNFLNKNSRGVLANTISSRVMISGNKRLPFVCGDFCTNRTTNFLQVFLERSIRENLHLGCLGLLGQGYRLRSMIACFYGLSHDFLFPMSGVVKTNSNLIPFDRNYCSGSKTGVFNGLPNRKRHDGSPTMELEVCKRCHESIINQVCELHDDCGMCKRCCPQAYFEQGLPFFLRLYVRTLWWIRYLRTKEKS